MAGLMRKLSVLLICFALTAVLRAGDFKRFYAANTGERIVSITALPGGGLWLKSQVEKGGGEVSRVLIPSMHRDYRIPDGLTPLAAAAESGILMQQGEKLYFRSLVKPGILLSYDFTKAYPEKFASQLSSSPSLLGLSYQNNESWCKVVISDTGLSSERKCDPNPSRSTSTTIGGTNITSHGFAFEKGAFVFHPKDKPHEISSLEPVDSGKTLIEWGQTAQISWAVTSESRNFPMAPPRRLIKIFSAADGVQLAKTQIVQEAPAKGLAVAFKLTPDSPDALAVITGAGLGWWAPKAEHIDDWGEVTLDLAAAKPAE